MRMISHAAVVALLAGLTHAAVAAAGGTIDGRIFDRDGKRIGEIRRDRWGGYEIFDEKSRRLGYGRESSDGRTIEFFAPDGRRLFELRRDDPPGGTPWRKRE